MLTKDEVIKEIQKYAKEHGGKTPSEKTLYEDTSVGVWDRMKYWPNYGELVLEAGLTPNKFDKTKFTREQLCDMFIGVIREKGKWPTRGSLEVKHFKDSTFPHSSTFYSKLGLTTDLAQTILEYVIDRQGFEDVIEICNSIIEKSKKSENISTDNAGEDKQGWVYLFKHGQYDHYRVGRTFDPLRRGKEIAIQLPERPTLVHEIKTVDPIGVETYWLNRFEKIGKRMNADWFKLSRTHVKEFKRWKRIT